MNSKKPILVTGLHRSGTTWVGRMIASAPSVGYIHEPFNIYDRGICGADFKYWFTYVTDLNSQDYHESIKNTLNYQYNLMGKLKRVKGLGDIKEAIKKYILFTMHRINKIRPLMKDPMAFFSAEWLATNYDMDVIIVIRHPAAFASSVKVLNWFHPLDHFLKQPLLMKDHLYLFKDEINKLAKEKGDIIDQAIVLWKLYHYMVKKYQKEHSDWIFVRHEDLSQNPIEQYRKLFKILGLEYSSNVENYIKNYSFKSDTSISTNKKNDHFDFKRNSTMTISSWKNRLTQLEIEKLKSQLQDISADFYSEEEWQ